MKSFLHCMTFFCAMIVCSSTTFAKNPIINATSNSHLASEIVTSVNSLPAFTSCFGSVSAEQSFTVSSDGVNSDITVKAPIGFEISLTPTVGFTDSLVLAQTLGAVATTSIYVRLKNDATGSPAGDVTCTPTLVVVGLASKNVAVTGTVNALPSASISGVPYNCTLVSLTASGGGTYFWSGGNSVNTAANTFSTTNSYTVTVTNAAGCTNMATQAIVINDCTNTWTGTTSTAWTTASNWSKSSLPNDTTSVTIPSGVSFFPNANTVQTVKDIIINSGAVLTVTGTLQVAGSISNSGTLTATTGTIEMLGASAQTIPLNSFSSNAIQNLTINNAAGVTLGGTLKVSGVLTPTSGVLTTGGNLILASTDIYGGGTIAAGGGSYISGNVTVQRFSQAQRGFRTISHPFTTAQSLSQLTDNIQITGLTTNNAGAYGVSTGNPSAFTYNPLAVSPASPLTSVTSSISTVWGVGKGLFLFIRGNANEASGLNYPTGINPVTADVVGIVNQGQVDVNVDYASGANNFNLIGNPYPCAIDLQSVVMNDASTFASKYGSVYVYSPAEQATSSTVSAGGFTQISTLGNPSIIIPSMGAFYILADANRTISFKENAKVTSTPTIGMFGTNSYKKIRLSISNKTIAMDDLLIGFDNKSTAKAGDFYDAVKLNNSLLDFYSLSSDKIALAIDYRSDLMLDTIMPLGINTTTTGKYSISLSELANLPNKQIILRDKLLKTETSLASIGDSYSFEITADAATKGDNRFEIGLANTKAPIIDLPSVATAFTAKLQTNVIGNEMTVSISQPIAKAVTIKLVNSLGQIVATKNTGAVTNAIVKIDTALQTGIYILQVSNGDETIILKAIK